MCSLQDKAIKRPRAGGRKRLPRFGVLGSGDRTILKQSAVENRLDSCQDEAGVFGVSFHHASASCES